MGNTSLEQLRQARDAVLLYVYEHAMSKPRGIVPVYEVQEALGLTDPEMEDARTVLSNQDLLSKHPRVFIGLNPKGQAEAEALAPRVRMRSPPEAPGNIAIDARYSIVQVAGANSTQRASLTVDQSQVTQLLERIEREIPTLDLKPMERAEASDLAAALRKGLVELPAAGVRAMAAALSAILIKGDARHLAHQLMTLVQITGSS